MTLPIELHDDDGAPADELPDELPALPIFPLANCVLLPGGMLPLHICEPRYRELARAALAGDHLIAIARLRPGRDAEYEGRPPVFPMAGVGRIICAEEMADGRFMLLLHGVGRVKIEHELPAAHAFRQVRARVVRDAGTSDAQRFRAARDRLLELCDLLARALDACGNQGGEQLRELARCDRGPGSCADAVAAALIMDTAERYRMLENPCPEARIRTTIEAVSQMLCAMAPCDGEVN